MAHYQKLYARAPRTSPRRRGSGNGESKSYVATVVVLAAILLPLLARVYLDRETLRMGRTWENQKTELRNLAQKTENLRIERESYLRGDYIRARAAQLGLRPALPGQVRFIQLAERDESGEQREAIAGTHVP